jgi:phosphoribosyl 1,2-cyclic phosphate phosphodiesterase
MMRVTLLGCGTSVGVPALGRAGWGRCDPQDPRNRRQRCAVLVEKNETRILIDAGPDIRNQLIPLGLPTLDAVLITHTHSDHVAGMDDLRVFYWPNKVKLPVLATRQHGMDVTRRFPYLFEKKPDSPSYFEPPLTLDEIEPGQAFTIGDIEIMPYYQGHGNSFSLGFKFDDLFAYSTDVVALDQAVLDDLHRIPLWIVESLRSEPHQAHAHYDLTFSWIDQVKPGQAVLTHLGLEADYAELAALCPAGVEPGIDGMVFELES